MDSDLTPPGKYFSFRSWRWPAAALIAASCLLAGIHMKGAVVPERPRDEKTVQGSIKRGDTISFLLGSLFSPQEINDLVRQCRDIYPLTKICVGQPYNLSLSEGTFKRFIYEIDSDNQLVIDRDKNGFSVSRQPISYTVEQIPVKGTIESSLFQAVVDIGESESLAIELADIFAWDIDFFQDIRAGDSFKVVVEKRYRKGQPSGNGRVLAASFTVQDRTYRAFYFQDGNQPAGYYDENGQSMRKAFLKAPLSFSRISSGFSMSRRHPVTDRMRAHPAIDYAAPTGTPVQTVGDGTVILAGYKGDNGNCVKVRHSNGWITMYNHLSRFGKDVRVGKRVQQGQVIGYVGSTGLSTGPHLDFRMYRDGVPVNPLKVKSPPAIPVPSARMADYKALVAGRLALMESQAPPAATKTAAAGADSGPQAL